MFKNFVISWICGTHCNFHLQMIRRGINVPLSGVGQGGQGGRVPLDSEKMPKIGKKREKIRKKREKEGKSGKRKNREGSFTLPLLTDRAGYMLLLPLVFLGTLPHKKWCWWPRGQRKSFLVGHCWYRTGFFFFFFFFLKANFFGKNKQTHLGNGSAAPLFLFCFCFCFWFWFCFCFFVLFLFSFSFSFLFFCFCFFVLSCFVLFCFLFLFCFVFWWVCTTRVSKSRVGPIGSEFQGVLGTKILKICVLRAEILVKTRLKMQNFSKNWEWGAHHSDALITGTDTFQCECPPGYRNPQVSIRPIHVWELDAQIICIPDYHRPFVIGPLGLPRSSKRGHHGHPAPGISHGMEPNTRPGTRSGGAVKLDSMWVMWQHRFTDLRDGYMYSIRITV